MKDVDYPGLYRSASTASADAQKALLIQFKANSALLILASAASLVSILSSWVAIVSLLLFLASLGVYIYSRFRDLQDQWYKARALAESIKTATWRFMMGAEPFNDSLVVRNRKKYADLLSELLVQNQKMAVFLTGDAAASAQITDKVLEVSGMDFDAKKAFYLVNRIQYQRGWYSGKASSSRLQARIYFGLICGCYFLAITLLAVRIANPHWVVLPVDLLAIIASSMIGWTQLKRFDELASSYAYTAHEVGIIEARFMDVNDEGELASFVADAENAFSREHTQWAARRDH